MKTVILTPIRVRVRLYWRKSDITSRWVYKESNLIFSKAVPSALLMSLEWEL